MSNEPDNDKVVDFKKFAPKVKLADDLDQILTEEQAKDLDRSYRESFAETVAVDIAQNVLMHMSLAGVNEVDGAEDAKDVIFMIQSIKSLILKGQQIYHPFQELAQTVLSVSDDFDIEEEE